MSTEIPLKSLDDAKVFFQAARCNRYFMEFASDERLAEYGAFNISRSTEREWAVEFVRDLATQLESGTIGHSELYWSKYSDLEEVILGWRFDHFLPLLLTATNSIAPRLSPLGRIVVAETILGRRDIQYRPGAIFRCADCGQRETAIELANVVHNLASTPFEPTELEKRRIKAIQRLVRIREMCNLSPR